MNINVLVLANSRKQGDRCIAGKMVVYVGAKCYIEDWIRPVTIHGSVRPQVSQIYKDTEDRSCSNNPFIKHMKKGKQPEVFDIISISFADNYEPPLYQPENRLIDENYEWKRIGGFDRSYLPEIVDYPSSLWEAGYGRTDCISSYEFRRFQGAGSLYLIRPRRLYFEAWTEPVYGQYQPQLKKRIKAVFEYASLDYKFSVTDPQFESRYFRPFPQLDEPIMVFEPPDPERFYLVVSLTAPLDNGNHYKLVASVLER